MLSNASHFQHSLLHMHAPATHLFYPDKPHNSTHINFTTNPMKLQAAKRGLHVSIDMKNTAHCGGSILTLHCRLHHNKGIKVAKRLWFLKT